MPPRYQRKIEEEVVEDSEPEREAARLEQLRTSKAMGSHFEKPSNSYTKAPSQNFELSDSIIEISDDSLVESSSHVLNKRNMSDLPQSKFLGEVDNSIIDISDSSIELLQSAGTIPKPFAPKAAGSTRLFVDLGDYNSELDNTLPELRLARYAHTSARANKPKTNPSHSARAMSTSSGSSRSAIVKKITAQTLVQQLSDEFNADSISRLLMCVCCNLKWTTRKSVSQKLTHFKTCAKKHGVQDDTLVELIRKGLIDSPAVQPKGKGTSIVVDDASPKTFFDEVMHDAAPKKRTRRQEVKSTVKDIAEMRNAILLKARAIVAKGDSDVRALREHGIGEHPDSDLSTNFVLSSTPRFAKSSLASRSGLQARYMFYNDGGTHESPPSSPFSPPIQQIPPSPPISSSGMGEVLQPLMDIDLHNLHTLSNTKYPVPRNSYSHSQSLISTSSRPNQATLKISKTFGTPNSPPLTPSPQKVISLTSSASPPTYSPFKDRYYTSDEDMRQYMDDAYLHYDPEDNTHSLSTTNQPLRRTPSQLSPAPLSPKSKSRSRSTTALRKKPAIKEKIVIDAAWAEVIRNKIMKDTTLHLRILRLEPIHFDVFLSKIEGQDQQPSAKLKHHLREFLDKQAINFYGAEPVGRQRR
ncbi:hypothetical protein C8J55DRAFT_512381 [Lentinula edodes]|uniref:Uncharacterized protein n=1 Tax=Lentinula lateritia TaxID=40482 RepID=A0A9W9DR55_9AGAR|nr:hypothetical protein C8J55DRAFT_512381 [Lentinula edodes]